MQGAPPRACTHLQVRHLRSLDFADCSMREKLLRTPTQSCSAMPAQRDGLIIPALTGAPGLLDASSAGAPAASVSEGNVTLLLHKLRGRLAHLNAEGARLERQPSEERAKAHAAATAAVTEEAFRAGVTCLGSGLTQGAEALLSVALSACPPGRPKAREKISRLLAQARSGASHTQ